MKPSSSLEVVVCKMRVELEGYVSSKMVYLLIVLEDFQLLKSNFSGARN